MIKDFVDFIPGWNSIFLSLLRCISGSMFIKKKMIYHVNDITKVTWKICAPDFMVKTNTTEHFNNE